MNTFTQPINIILLILAGLAGALSFVWWEQDDLFIHAQYARHVAEFGEWSFNRGEPSYGSTSPLWILALALPGYFGIPIYFAAKGISVACFLITLLQLYRWRPHFHAPDLHSVMLIAVVANHWLRLGTGSGMEATLAACLIIEFANRLYLTKPTENHHYLILGVLAGLATLCRPELVYLPVAVLALPSSRLRHVMIRMLITGAGMMLVLGPWLAYSHFIFGSMIPQTVYVKTTAYYLKQGNPVIATLIRSVAFYAPAIGVEIIAVVLLAVTSLRRKTMNLLFAVPPSVWLTALGLPAIYVLNQIRGSEGITYRYAAPVLALLIYIGFRCLDQWFHQANDARRAYIRPVAVVITAVTLLVQGGLSVLHWPALKRSHHYVHHVLWPAAEWMKANSEPDDSVACFDVGVMGYVSDRHVRDFIGLISPDVFRYIQSSKTTLSHAELIAHFQPDYLFGTRPADRAPAAGYLPVFCQEFESFRFLPSIALGAQKPVNMVGCLYRLVPPEAQRDEAPPASGKNPATEL